MIRAAHEKGLWVIGGTLLPIGGSKYDTPTAEATLAAVNDWIRASGAFDSVIDFARVVRDPADPSGCGRPMTAGTASTPMTPDTRPWRMRSA